MQWFLSLPHGVFMDYTVWDNDSVYALVTFVSIAFAIVLIATVLRQTKNHDSAMRTLVTKRPITDVVDSSENDVQ